MASISKRGESWQARISYKNHDGEYKQKTQGGFRTKKSASEFTNKVENDIANGILPSD